jgi:D-xylose transport system substrate-binding protein
MKERFYASRVKVAAAAMALCVASSVVSIGLNTGSASAAGGTVTVNTKLTGSVYMLWPNTTTPGWPTYYIPSMVSAFKKYLPKMKIVQESANNSQTTQQGQVQAAIASHATAVVLSPPDPQLAGAELKELKAAKIPVVAYNNDPDGGPVFAYVWVNFGYVGQWFGKWLSTNLVKKVGHTPVRLAEIYGDPTFAVYNNWLAGITPILQPLIKSGKVQVVCKANTPGWVPATAQTAMQACLTKTGHKVDAVLTMNDSTTDGVAAALQGASPNLLGKVLLVGGHDGDLLSVQRVLAGDEVATFHPDGVQAGKAAAALIQAALQGKSAKSTGYINASFNNGFVKGGVPTVEAPEQLIIPSTVQQTIVNEGILTKGAICTGIAAKSKYCVG